MLSGTCGRNVTWTLDGDTLTISGTGNMKIYDIAEKEFAPWHDKCKSIKKVIVKTGVTSIGNAAFLDCENLVEVTLPDSVREIGDYAFEYCSSLTEIKIPDDVEYIGGEAFYSCKSLKTITIPLYVTKIGHMAFANCSSLKEVIILANVSDVDENIFLYCDELEKIYYRKNSGFKRGYWREGHNAEFVPYTDFPHAPQSSAQLVSTPNLKWQLEGETLTIIDADALKKFSRDENAPWYDKRDSIKKIVIETPNAEKFSQADNGKNDYEDFL